MAAGPFAFAELPWLPRAAAGFRDQLLAASASEAADWAPQLRALASQALSLNQAVALAKVLDKQRARGPVKSLTSFRLGLVGNVTTDFLKPMLAASALRHGISLEIVSADFGQLMQEAIDPGSKLNRAGLNAVLLAINHQGLPFRASGATAWPLFDATAALAELDAVREGFRKNSGAVCLVQTIPPPAELLLGSLDIATSGTLRAALARFNSEVARGAAERGDVLIDVDWLASCVGLDAWHDERQWHIARVPCSQKALPAYADFICRTLGAMRGKARKCLVLDLDNTLWGGVIGDDGLEGIALNPGDPRGEAFRAIQQTALDLRRRGVVLAVCSKNDDATARTPFRSHSGMLLKESDIAVFIANWDDKATNIERIASQLELGIDSMVLLDDNPTERAQVRQVLPQVAVPELGEDPSTYVRTLLSAGYFESTAFTQEDLARAGQYQGNAQRAQALEGSRDMNEFLRSLQMEIEFAPFTAQGRKRITQLINKTNQFNVTTRRYTEQQVAAFEADATHYTLQVSVRDRFGDNGMIGVVIGTRAGNDVEIDTWLMSCRVINRGVEQATCNRLAADARAAGGKRLVGTYTATDRNSIVSDLYSRLGFTLAEETGSTQRWVLDLERFQPHEVFCTEKTLQAPGPQVASG
ncbi:MAG: HAD-IIIC family phosphatase [Gammaproteobacteria bacterium]